MAKLLPPLFTIDMPDYFVNPDQSAFHILAKFNEHFFENSDEKQPVTIKDVIDWANHEQYLRDLIWLMGIVENGELNMIMRRVFSHLVELEHAHSAKPIADIGELIIRAQSLSN